MAGSISVPPTNNGGGVMKKRMREHYEIEYARFFNFPNPDNSNPNDRDGSSRRRRVVVNENNNNANSEEDIYYTANRRPLPKYMKRRQRGGTWLSSSSAASLHLYFTNTHHHSLPQLLLLIYLHHKIYIHKEEHYVSKLHFSWPQVSSVSQCPVGSSGRVVFASYKDRVGQIQKFAMRFMSSSESRAFISSLKESLNDERNIGIPNTYFRSENLYQNEFITANEVHHRADEALINGYLAANYPPLTESSFNDGVQNTCSEETTLRRDYADTCAPLPPRLTEFLAGDCTEVQQEPPLASEEVDLNTRIAKYMTASSFNDMLIKLEKLINDLGGDLVLRPLTHSTVVSFVHRPVSGVNE